MILKKKAYQTHELYWEHGGWYHGKHAMPQAESSIRLEKMLEGSSPMMGRGECQHN